MSTTALQGLLDYLCTALSAKDMRWVASHLIDQADSKEEPAELKRYTMDEIYAMLEASEEEIAAGKGTPDEEVWRRYDEERARERKNEMAAL